MCRVLSYLGKPILAEELLYQPDNSFIKQSYHPRHMSHLLNLAGFGIAAWDRRSHDSELPFLYKTPNLPFYDENLKNLASKINPQCLLAHLRGVSYSEGSVVSNQNVHPFLFPNENILLAHNGALADFEIMKFDLLEAIAPRYQQHIRGTTDTEWIYALFLTQLHANDAPVDADNIIEAINKTLKILQKIRHKHRIQITSPVNLFISNGSFIAATRFVLDYGWAPFHEVSTHYSYHSLWYTYGDSYGFFDGSYKMRNGGAMSSIIIASEPLTEDSTTWIEVPEYSVIVASRVGDEVKIVSRDLSI